MCTHSREHQLNPSQTLIHSVAHSLTLSPTDSRHDLRPSTQYIKGDGDKAQIALQGHNKDHRQGVRRIGHDESGLRVWVASDHE